VEGTGEGGRENGNKMGRMEKERISNKNKEKCREGMKRGWGSVKVGKKEMKQGEKEKR